MAGQPGRTVRKRLLPSPGASGSCVQVWQSSHPTDNPKYSTSNYSGTIAAAAYHGKQVTVSDNHPQWRSIRGSSGDIGGPFSMERWEVICPMTTTIIHRKEDIDQWRSRETTYRGPCLPFAGEVTLTNPDHSSFGFPKPLLTSDSSLESLGATAVSLVKPTNSIADLSVFLGELLREGLPSLAGHTLFKPKGRPDSFKGRVKDSPKDVSSEFLNTEFGWKPIISDMNKFAEVLAHVKRVYEQYVRDSGRIVRRRYEFPTITSEKTSVLGSNRRAVLACTGTGPLFASYLPNARLVRTEVTSIRRWFSGAFTYYVPPLDKLGPIAHYGAIADKLVGSTIDPETIWNLAPWSWAIDWFTNVGDVTSNVSDMINDGLVMRWGYMMEHTVSSITFTLQGPSGYWGNPVVSPITVLYERKKRVKANPFGFGISDGALSLRQKAILTALGISRKK